MIALSPHRRSAFAAVLVFCGAHLAPTNLGAQSPDERAVLAVAQALFDAMAARDTAAFRSVMFADGRTLAVEEVDGEARFRWGSGDEFAQVLANAGPALLERMWNAEVRVSGPIATVWTPYDFRLDGSFSHCGIDAFQFVRTPEGWRIAVVMYTLVRPQERCPPSPLGDPEL